MQHHQLAQLREKLGIWKSKYFHAKTLNEKVTCKSVIKQTEGMIDTLGARGILKMALVVISKAPAYLDKPTITTLSYFFHDLDDESIYVLLDAYLKTRESYISKSIIEVPLKQPLPTSLKNNIISWQIN